jgi:hypothetical protein
VGFSSRVSGYFGRPVFGRRGISLLSLFDCEIISGPRLGDRVGDGVARLKLDFDSVFGTRRASALGLRCFGRGPDRFMDPG